MWKPRAVVVKVHKEPKKTINSMVILLAYGFWILRSQPDLLYFSPQPLTLTVCSETCTWLDSHGPSHPWNSHVSTTRNTYGWPHLANASETVLTRTTRTKRRVVHTYACIQPTYLPTHQPTIYASTPSIRHFILYARAAHRPILHSPKKKKWVGKASHIVSPKRKRKKNSEARRTVAIFWERGAM